jgi:uncharacterized membrane protein YfcA
MFRLYATAVASGIGSIFGWCVGWWILGEQIPYGWVAGIFGMCVAVGSFGMTAYKHSQALRGDAPTKFAWVSKEEFEGT